MGHFTSPRAKSKKLSWRFFFPESNQEFLKSQSCPDMGRTKSAKSWIVAKNSSHKPEVSVPVNSPEESMLTKEVIEEAQDVFKSVAGVGEGWRSWGSVIALSLQLQKKEVCTCSCEFMLVWQSIQSGGDALQERIEWQQIINNILRLYVASWGRDKTFVAPTENLKKTNQEKWCFFYNFALLFLVPQEIRYNWECKNRNLPSGIQLRMKSMPVRLHQRPCEARWGQIVRQVQVQVQTVCFHSQQEQAQNFVHKIKMVCEFVLKHLRKVFQTVNKQAFLQWSCIGPMQHCEGSCREAW